MPRQLTSTCVWRLTPALVMALAERFGDPVDAYVNGSQTWLRDDGPGEIAIEWRLHPVAGYHKPDDIDVAQLYDDFTMMPMIMMEDLGFCPKGQIGPFIENTDLSITGELPMNTFGGMLSHGNSIGFGHLVEGARQVMGQAGPTQVANAEVVLIAGLGGPCIGSNTTLILGR